MSNRSFGGDVVFVDPEFTGVSTDGRPGPRALNLQPFSTSPGRLDHHGPANGSRQRVLRMETGLVFRCADNEIQLRPAVPAIGKRSLTSLFAQRALGLRSGLCLSSGPGQGGAKSTSWSRWGKENSSIPFIPGRSRRPRIAGTQAPRATANFTPMACWCKGPPSPSTLNHHLVSQTTRPPDIKRGPLHPSGLGDGRRLGRSARSGAYVRDHDR